MKYSDTQRIMKILDYAKKLMQFLEETGLDKETLTNDYKMQWAVTTPLYNIGEHSNETTDNNRNIMADIRYLKKRKRLLRNQKNKGFIIQRRVC